MARRRKLTLELQLMGAKAALGSSRTPAQLREGLRKRVEDLKRKLGKAGTQTRRRRKGSDFMSVLGLR